MSTENQYCASCGAEIRAEAEICPHCGVQQETGETGDAGLETLDIVLTVVGAVSGAVGFLFLPILFGPVAALCGVVLAVRERTFWGIALIVWGLLSTITGVVLGLLAVLGTV